MGKGLFEMQKVKKLKFFLKNNFVKKKKKNCPKVKKNNLFNF